MAAAAPSGFDDDATPLARAAEHTRAGPQRAPAPGRAAPRPPATRVFVVANQKGGVGKTTTTVNVAAALAQLGQRVLVIDLDPQGNASTALSVDHHRGVPSTYDMLVDGAPLADVMQPSPTRSPASASSRPPSTSPAPRSSWSAWWPARPGCSTALHAHPRIGSADEAGEDRFDYVLIDCPPSLGLLTLNALVAGAEMLIPIQAEYYALEGLGQLLETVDMVRAHLNPSLVVSTILLTMYDARTRLAAGVADEVREHFGDAGAADRHPALGAGLGGAVLRPDRDDLRSGVARRAELPRGSPRDRHQGSPR